LCISRERTHYATLLNTPTKHAVLLLGCDKYLTMDSFCGATQNSSCEECPLKPCDFDGLRSEIEKLITAILISE
jgi:hypothetical protein